jgi:precorrin-6Y C5,15-methyltransferase (decarboxylating)
VRGWENRTDVDVVTLEQLATGSFDPMSVVVLDGDGVAATPTLEWGRSERRFARDGLVTKRSGAVALGKLAIPTAGVIWDVGAGSGSVAIEIAARAACACDRRRTARRRRASHRDERHRARRHDRGRPRRGARRARAAARSRPVFVGGGGIAVLDAVLARLRAGGRGRHVRRSRPGRGGVRTSREPRRGLGGGGMPLAGGVRLQAENPVFVVWGPES